MSVCSGKTSRQLIMLRPGACTTSTLLVGVLTTTCATLTTQGSTARERERAEEFCSNQLNKSGQQ